MASILKAIDTHHWTWGDVACGHLVGMKVGKEFTKSYHKEGFTNWIGTLFDSYRMYNQASSLGLFEKFPGLMKPLKYGAIAIAVMNLQTLYMGHVKRVNKTDLYIKHGWQDDSTLFQRFSARIWNWTPTVLVGSQLAVIAFEYQKRPMQAVACLSAAMITLAARTEVLPKDLRSLWTSSQWVAQANLAWNGNWAGPGIKVLKVFGKIFS